MSTLLVHSRLVLLSCLLVGLGLSLEAFGVLAQNRQAPPDQEYAIKAARLLKFAQYTTWPEEAFRDSDGKLIVAVLGRDPFGDILEQTLRGRRAGKRAIEVRHYPELEKLGVAQVLFVPSVESKRVPEILEATKGRHVLLVGESGGFARAGGIVGFFIEGRRVRFEIHVDEARRAGLKLSSRLLALARIVRDGEG